MLLISICEKEESFNRPLRRGQVANREKGLGTEGPPIAVFGMWLHLANVESFLLKSRILKWFMSTRSIPEFFVFFPTYEFSQLKTFV